MDIIKLDQKLSLALDAMETKKRSRKAKTFICWVVRAGRNNLFYLISEIDERLYCIAPLQDLGFISIPCFEKIGLNFFSDRVVSGCNYFDEFDVIEYDLLMKIGLGLSSDTSLSAKIPRMEIINPKSYAWVVDFIPQKGGPRTVDKTTLVSFDLYKNIWIPPLNDDKPIISQEEFIVNCNYRCYFGFNVVKYEDGDYNITINHSLPLNNKQ